ncbi:uncharacterized protein LOC116805326 isoform X2 [Drosophila grimshawi]|uniref:uncharacterized protein LOC116805326 isoform X2 n=1 Tax=Drosophila grimshawi TaxID=7222 RepID=UPI000C87055A|nr:uncharacterized protein LOC116805326 isoform X2 [Drosophila grimshawi]
MKHKLRAAHSSTQQNKKPKKSRHRPPAKQTHTIMHVVVATRCAQKVQQKEILLFIEPGRTPLHKGKTNFTTIVNGEKMWNTHGSHISQYQIIIK